ncbi:MAG: hypothetical protein JSV88_14950, partial [Candidatus Aminicenantes bacterium]
MKMIPSKKLDKKSIEDIIALTPLQQGMLFHYLKEPGPDLYFEQLSIGISGPVDINCFKQAWNIVVDTNEMLRAVFQWERLKHPIQAILKTHHLSLRYDDLTSTGETRTLKDVKARDRNEKFDLGEVPFRVRLCKINENRFEVIISSHHILYDGWSNGIILKEFFKAYHDLCNKKNPVKPVKTTFKEFVKWMRSQGTDRYKQERFWRNYLNGFDTPTRLAVKKIRAQEGVYPGNSLIRFKEDIKNRLEDFVKNGGITLASFLYGVWGILVQRYNNSGDVVFGTTVAGRSAKIKGIEDIVGLFINTVPLRVQTQPGSNEKIGEFLERIHRSLRMRTVYEHTSLPDIKEYSEINNADELFDTIVVIENYPLSSRLIPGNSKLSIDSYTMVEMTHYDLTVNITVSDGIVVNAAYNKYLFEEETMVRLLHHFERVVGNILDNPGARVTGIEVLSKAEKNQILYEFNCTDVEYPK